MFFKKKAGLDGFYIAKSKD